MTEKTIRWFEGFPEVIKRGEEQDGFFLALAATLASEMPFAEIEEPEMAEEVENQSVAKPTMKRTWQPDPSWHEKLVNPLDSTPLEKIFLEVKLILRANFEKFPLADISELALRYSKTSLAKQREGIGALQNEIQNQVEEACFQQLHSIASEAIFVKLLNQDLSAGNSVDSPEVLHAFYDKFGSLGILLLLSIIFNQLGNTEVSPDEISILGETTFLLTELGIKPGVNILGIVESSDNSVKPLHLSLSIDEGKKIMIQSSSPSYILRQHPHWFNFLNDVDYSKMLVTFSLMAGANFSRGASDSGDNQLPTSMCKLEAIVQLDDVEAPPLKLLLPLGESNAPLAVTNELFSLLTLSGQTYSHEPTVISQS